MRWRPDVCRCVSDDVNDMMIKNEGSRVPKYIRVLNLTSGTTQRRQRQGDPLRFENDRKDPTAVSDLITHVSCSEIKHLCDPKQVVDILVEGAVEGYNKSLPLPLLVPYTHIERRAGSGKTRIWSKSPFQAVSRTEARFDGAAV